MELRIGKVSTVNYKTGMVSVIYEEENNAVTAKMPCLSFNGEYKMPKADDYVAVAYLSNGSSIGLILGSFWNEKNRPKHPGKGVYHKEFAPNAYIHYDKDTLTLYAPNVKVITKSPVDKEVLTDEQFRKLE